MQEEYERMDKLRKREKETLEEQIKMWQNKAERELEKEKKKGEDKYEEVIRRKDNEIKNIKE